MRRALVAYCIVSAVLLAGLGWGLSTASGMESAPSGWTVLHVERDSQDCLSTKGSSSGQQKVCPGGDLAIGETESSWFTPAGVCTTWWIGDGRHTTVSGWPGGVWTDVAQGWNHPLDIHVTAEIDCWTE